MHLNDTEWYPLSNTPFPKQDGCFIPSLTLHNLLLLRIPLDLNLIIPRHKELCKQVKVAPVHDKGRNIVLLPDMTCLSQNRITVIVKRHNGNSHPNKHLRKLHERHEHGVEPFGTEFDRHEEVVPIHDRVDTVVHDDEEETTGRSGHIGMPAVKKDGDMMIPMEEDERLLVNDNEESVKQLGKLAQNEQLHPKSRRSTPIQRRRIIAQIIPQRIRRQVVIQLRSRPDRANPREERQAQIPNGQNPPPAPCRPVLHVGASQDDEHDVGDAGDDGDHGTILHPGEGGDGIVEAFEGEVGGAEERVEAGEFGVVDSEAVGAYAFFGDAG
mmetsp:Transcript_15757/g.34031  ORF Transcript_15757/g.34031 Transcript_15757/m.34031 type:complete len:326 (-) Transcript_15757:102-1079(-)